MTTFSDRVWVVVPAYNVGRYLPDLLLGIARHVPLSRVIVVDDGSTDHTGQVGRNAGAEVIGQVRNLGKGEALKAGYRHCIKAGGEWIVTIDGDLQHDPASLPDFLSLAGSDKYDMLIGKRQIAGSKMPLDRRFSNWTSSRLLSLVVGQRLYDIQCGYRMVRATSLIGVVCESSRYDFEIELLLRLIRKGARIGWVGVPTIYADEASSIHRASDTWRFLKWVVRFIAGRV